MSSGGVNPSLVISQYYDSLVREIDLFTEQTLAENRQHLDAVFKPWVINYTPEKYEFVGYDFKEREVVEDPRNLVYEKIMKRNISNHRYNLKFREKPSSLNAEQDSTIMLNVRDYYNKARDMMLAQVERAQQETFRTYETIRSELKTTIVENESLNREEKIENIMARVFADKFLIFVEQKSSTSLTYYDNQEMHLVVLDFYLDKRLREHLANFDCFSRWLDSFPVKTNIISYGKILNQEYLICLFLHDYIRELRCSLDQVKHEVIKYVYATNSEEKEIHSTRNLFEVFQVNKRDLVSIHELELNVGKNYNYIDIDGDLTSLKYLSLSCKDCETKTLHLRRLNLPSLEYLRLARSIPVDLEASFFLNIANNLRCFILKRCDFKKVSSGAFSALVNLEILEMFKPKNCSHIRLEDLPNLKWLKLDVEGSDLPMIKGLSENLEGLDYSRWSNPPQTNDFSDPVIQMISEFKKLKYLSLSDDYYEFNFDKLSELPDLKYIRMYNCELNKLFCTKFNSKIASMYDTVDGEVKTIKTFPSLQTLELLHNQLSSFNPLLSASMPNLLKLVLNHNKFSKITKDMFANLDNLKHLVLDFNKIFALEDECFASLSSLEILHLSFNYIQSVNANTFKGLGKLKKLNLGACNLENMSKDALVESFSTIKHVEKIDIRGNSLGYATINCIRETFPDIILND